MPHRRSCAPSSGVATAGPHTGLPQPARHGGAPWRKRPLYHGHQPAARWHAALQRARIAQPPPGLPRPRHALCASPASVLFRNGRPTCAAGSNAPAAMPPRRTRRLPNGPGCFHQPFRACSTLAAPARPRWPWDAAHRRAWKIRRNGASPPRGTSRHRNRKQAQGTSARYSCRAGASPAPADQRPRQTGAPANSPAPQGTPAVVGGRENLPEARPASKTPAQRTGRCACSPSRRTARHSPLSVRAAVCKGHQLLSQKPRQIQRAAHARRRAGAQKGSSPHTTSTPSSAAGRYR